MVSTLELAERVSAISVSSTMKVAADAERLRREGKDVVDFSVGEPDFPTPDNIKKAAVDALDQNFTRYTNAGGVQELKDAIVWRHKTDYGTDYKVNECLVTVGGKHAIFNLMQILVNPGDEVIIPVPYWVTFKDVVNYAGGKCVFVNTDEEKGFALTAKMVEDHITPKTKIILINSPTNPSGAVVERGEFEKIFHLAKSKGIYLMTDECYCRFLYEEEPFSIASMPGAKDTVVVAGSLSKTYAMTGWRIGFVLAPASIIGGINKLQSHSTSNPTSIAQKAAIEALRGPQDSVVAMLAEYRKRRTYVIDRLRAMPALKVQMPLGAFYAYPNLSGVFSEKNGITSGMAFAEKLLAEEFVATVPGEAFGTDSHVRISYAASMEDITRGLDRIEKFIGRQLGK
ncbi:aminotransferase [Bryobacterales bacterium F-183]|nr:aminotransferase [Bryobacterales bacterium F-183]